MISPNVMIMYPGSNASIPTGYTRETLMDGNYPKGTADATNPNTTGGASNHTHSSPSHTHTISNHTHTVSFSTAKHESSDTTGDPGSNSRNQDHTHSVSTQTMNSQSVTSASVTYASVSNDPPYYTVIFIKANGYQAIPNDCILYANTTNLPSGFAQHTASDDRYFKGASTSGNGGDTGGSTTNTHTIAHTHPTAHTHSGNTGGPSTGSTTWATSGGATPIIVSPNHTHAYNLLTSSATSSSNSSIGSQAETVEPAHTKLRAIQNTSGSDKLPQPGMVAMWLGTLDNIPPGWILCDGTNNTQDLRGKYVKNGDSGEIGDTGGSNTHTHVAEGHTHTLASHTHSGTISPATGVYPPIGNGHNPWTNTSTNMHTVTSVGSQTGALASANTTANSSSNEPSYRTVAFIEFNYMVAGSALFGLL